MDISALCDFVYEDLEPQIVASNLSSQAICLQLECESGDGTYKNRTFSINCNVVVESTITVGAIGGISYVEDHPVLSSHKGWQASLYFSSIPTSPADVYFIACQLIFSWSGNWVAIEEILNGSPDEVWSHLAGGHGLLASGPLDLIERLAKNLEPILKINLVKTVNLTKSWKALLVDDQYLICESISVEEITG